MRAFLVSVVFVGISLVGVAAFGSSVPDPSDPSAFVAALSSAITAHRWSVLAALLVIALVWLARRYGPMKWEWLRGDRGGAALALVGSILVTLATDIASGKSFSALWLMDALMLGMTAAGGYSVVRKLIAPSDKP